MGDFGKGILVGAALTLAGVTMLSCAAKAHTRWANGDPIPDWIKSSCCGPADAHLLQPSQVHRDGDWYTVDGYTNPDGSLRPIRAESALPSQDGEYWIFYRVLSGGFPGSVYCFFVPMDF